MSEHLDFDKHYAQYERVGSTITVKGETYELPYDIPMTYVLLLVQGEAHPLDVQLTTMGILFGEEVVHGWMEGGMTRDEYGELVEMVLSHYAKNVEGADTAEGDDDAPKAEESS